MMVVTCFHEQVLLLEQDVMQDHPMNRGWDEELTLEFFLDYSMAASTHESCFIENGRIATSLCKEAMEVGVT